MNPLVIIISKHDDDDECCKDRDDIFHSDGARSFELMNNDQKQQQESQLFERGRSSKRKSARNSSKKIEGFTDDLKLNAGELSQKNKKANELSHVTKFLANKNNDDDDDVDECKPLKASLSLSIASFYSDENNSSIGSADSILFFESEEAKVLKPTYVDSASSSLASEHQDKSPLKTNKVKPNSRIKISKQSRAGNCVVKSPKKNRSSKCNKFSGRAEAKTSHSIVKFNDSNSKSIKSRLLNSLNANFRRLTDNKRGPEPSVQPTDSATTPDALRSTLNDSDSSLASAFSSLSPNTNSYSAKGTYETGSQQHTQSIPSVRFSQSKSEIKANNHSAFLSFFRLVTHVNAYKKKSNASFDANSTLQLNNSIDNKRGSILNESGDTKYIQVHAVDNHQYNHSSNNRYHNLRTNSNRMNCIGANNSKAEQRESGDIVQANEVEREGERQNELKPPGSGLQRNISRSFNSLLIGVRKSLLLKTPRSSSSAAARNKSTELPQTIDMGASLDKNEPSTSKLKRFKSNKEERKLVKSQTFQENKGRRFRTLFLKSTSTLKKSRDELSSYYISNAAEENKENPNEKENQIDLSKTDKGAADDKPNESAPNENDNAPPPEYMAESSSKQVANGKATGAEVKNKTIKSPLVKTKNKHSILKSLDHSTEIHESMSRLDRQDTIVGSTLSNQNLEDDAKLICTTPNEDASGIVKNKQLDALEIKLLHQDSKSSAPSQLAPVVESNDKIMYYELRVRLKEGKNLAIRDLCGTSDPYVKFQLNGNSVYKSKIILKNLNPVWNEEFVVKLAPSLIKEISFADERHHRMSESTSLVSWTHAKNSFNESYLTSAQLEFFLTKFKLKMLVYDYDRGFLNDDLIGYANIDLTSLKENVEMPFEVELEDEKLNKYEYLGLISLDLTLVPRYLKDERDAALNKLSASNTSALRTRRPGTIQQWQSVLNVVLLEGNDLISMDDNGFSDPYVKFKLENERYRSRTIKRTLNPKFLEQFQLYIYDNNKMQLHLSVYDYDGGSGTDDFMGKTSIDLRTLEAEKTHFLRLPLEDGAGTISLLVTITGTYGPDSTTDIEYNKESTAVSTRYFDNIIRKYGLLNSFKNIDDVGWLQVKVLRAEGLASADMNGKSDPFCSLQLINQYVQTHTEYKTLCPEWGKLFEFNVTDIHAVLEVTVLDEDKNKVVEFLGKVEIPIIQIQNGKRKFYALKDKKLVRRAKGAIELEMTMIYNPIKAVVKTFNPREEKYLPPEPKLKIPILKQNIMRVHNVVQGIINTGSFIDSCFRWVHPIRSIISFIAFIIIVLNFELYMLPLSILMIFLKNYVIIKLKAAGTSLNSSIDDDDSINFDFVDEEEDTGDPESKEPKKSFRERLNEIQEICLKVQETLDYIASLGERIINTFTFTIPWLSWLAIVVLLISSFILYMIPLRYLLLAWGINKFTKKFRKPPNYVDNTEILDFLSRVPSKKEVFQYRELRVEKTSITNATQLNSQTSVTVSKERKKKKA